MDKKTKELVGAIAILIALAVGMFFFTNKVEAKESIFPIIVDLLIEVNVELRAQIADMQELINSIDREKQVAQAQLWGCKADLELYRPDTPKVTPTVDTGAKLELPTTKPKQFCYDNGFCYTISDNHHI